ncbi:MAG: hypothetical protein WC955_11725 [Elusimicrobiota bacterium]
MKNKPGQKNIKDMLWGEMTASSFCREGHFMALQLNFPGMTTPIPMNESYITALTRGKNDIIFGGTSGTTAHIFAASIRSTSGIAVDFGGDSVSTECRGLTCTSGDILVAGVNTPNNGRLWTRNAMTAMPDCIQEWGFDVSQPKIAYNFPKGEKVLCLTTDTTTVFVIGLTNKHVFMFNPKSNTVRLYNKQNIIRLTNLGGGNVVALTSKGVVYKVETDKTMEIKFVALTKLDKCFTNKNVCISSNSIGGTFYIADGKGSIYGINLKKRNVKKVTSAHLRPVKCMTITNDGRLYGFCGDGMTNLFVYTPRTGEYKNLGVAVSVLNLRRYGYEFSCAVTGHDGELMFGENDRGGCLWAYFPKI